MFKATHINSSLAPGIFPEAYFEFMRDLEQKLYFSSVGYDNDVLVTYTYVSGPWVGIRVRRLSGVLANSRWVSVLDQITLEGGTVGIEHLVPDLSTTNVHSLYFFKGLSARVEWVSSGFVFENPVLTCECH